jgi:spore maturation protein B
MMEQILNEISRWAIPVLFFLFLVVGWLRRVPVYEAFIQGASEGFQIAVRIIPIFPELQGGLPVLKLKPGNHS